MRRIFPMSITATASIPLLDLPAGQPARLAEIRGGRGLERRLLGLGLRIGSPVIVLHRRGRGLVLASGDTRIALGGGVVEKLWAQPSDGGPEAG